MNVFFSSKRLSTRIAISCAAAVLSVIPAPSTHGETLPQSLPVQEAVRLGERMYREGILPSGEPMSAYVRGDLPVPGTAFSCVSCHLRSGLGSFEGGVVTPPTNGSNLFQPFQIFYKGIEQKYFPIPPRRPAYTDATLADVIRSGATPTGQALNDVMPRYLLDDGDMAILITYLKSLSSRFSPGVSKTNIRFATIISDDVVPGERDAMLAVLDTYVNIKNNQAKAYMEPGNKSRQMAENMLISKELATRTVTLSRWYLKGSPVTWRAQLEEYYRREPVFAFLGGMSRGEWGPIHQFSEDKQIPCLFPITDSPVVSKTDWYTMYLSKGYYQEGEAAARYLNGITELLKGRPVLQIVRDSREGRALSAGFQETWQELGHPTALTVTVKANEAVNGDVLMRMVDREHPAALIVWDGAGILPELKTMAGATNRPELIIVSAGYLGKQLWSMPEPIREITYLTFPFTFTQQSVKSSMMGSVKVADDLQKTLQAHNMMVQDEARKTTSLTNSLTRLLTMSLMDMAGNYYRDNFLDVIGMAPDQPSSVYGRLSFGPGQRYASKGCYIVQLGKGLNPELIKKSDWVIH